MTIVDSGEVFLGHYRKDVKTSIGRVNGTVVPPDEYADLGSLLDHEVQVSIRVTGSLFVDGDHRAGEVGPPAHQPWAVWKVHPSLILSGYEPRPVIDST